MLLPVVVRLLVLIALALSLGEVRDATDTMNQQVSLLEVEPELNADPIVIEQSIVYVLPRSLGVYRENLALPPCALDAGRVFRPPRVLAA